MLLIADGGSTKTDWRLIKDDVTPSLTTIGINPLFIDKDQVIRVLEESDIIKYKSEIEKVYFYGAGLANDKIKNDLFKIFTQFFGSETEIHINDDMIAAARALFKKSSGIACILGTGSNSCLYNGQTIDDKVPALGYILGDEGSGAHIGKLFINALLKRDFSDELTNKLLLLEELEMGRIIEQVYKRPFPNKYLASFTRIIIQYKEYEELQRIVKLAFNEFITKNILKYRNSSHLPIGFVGSIAYHFSDILNTVLKNYGFSEALIIQSPIDELVAYHRSL